MGIFIFDLLVLNCLAVEFEISTNITKLQGFRAKFQTPPRLYCTFQSGAMVRLTTEVVAKAPSYINPIKDRELDLRGNRIPAIENLAVSKVCPSDLRGRY